MLKHIWGGWMHDNNNNNNKNTETVKQSKATTDWKKKSKRNQQIELAEAEKKNGECVVVTVGLRWQESSILRAPKPMKAPERLSLCVIYKAHHMNARLAPAKIKHNLYSPRVQRIMFGVGEVLWSKCCWFGCGTRPNAICAHTNGHITSLYVVCTYVMCRVSLVMTIEKNLSRL